MHIASDSDLSTIFEMKTIAVVGLSPNTMRTSHNVAAVMQGHGYRIIPVNPGQNEILGEKAYASLLDIPEPVDIVNVFRRSEYTAPVAVDAAAIGAKAFWLQLGIVNDEAMETSLRAGLIAVQNMCIKVEYARIKLWG